MSDRISRIIVLAEDREHQNLVRRYMLRCGHEQRSFRFLSLPGSQGCGSQFVREEFSNQVTSCRQAVSRGASCMLIVITDADHLTTLAREQTLHEALRQSGQGKIDAAEAVIILIPKWQVGTWVKCLLGQPMDEDDPNSDRPEVTAEQIKRGANALFDWARPNAQVGPVCVPSLSAAPPRWRRIG